IFWGTASLQFVPWNQFLFESILDGHLPFWNPYNGLGVPFIANHQSAVFYPLNWLLLLFYILGNIKGLAIGITLLIPVHLSIAGLGMIKLLNSLNRSKASQLIAALIFVFSGYILTRLSFISMVWTFAWVPWIIYASIHLKSPNKIDEWKNSLVLAVLIALQLLAGHAQTTFYTLLLSGFFLLFHNLETMKLQFRKFIFFTISIFISVLLAAVQIIPTYELLKYSQRSEEIGYDLAVSSSLWPGRLMTVLFGNFWGNPNYNRFLSGGSFWEENLYLGVFPILITSLILWFLLRRNRQSQISTKDKFFLFSLFILTFFSIIFSFGRFTPVYPFLYQYIPLFNLFQAPSRFLLTYTLLISILFSFGYDLWISSKFNFRKTIIYFIVFGGLSLLLVGIKVIYPEFPLISMNSLLIGCLLGFLFGITTLIKDRLRVRNIWIHLAIIFIVSIDLISHNFLSNNFESINVYEKLNKNSQFNDTKRIYLSPESENFLKFSLFFRPDRLQPLIDNLSYLPSFIPNTNLLNNRFQMVNNFDPLQLKKYSEFYGWITSLKNDEVEKVISMVAGEYIISLKPDKSNYFDIRENNSKEFVQWYTCAQPFKSDEFFTDILLSEISDSENRCIFINESFELHGDEINPSELNPEIDYGSVSSNTYIINYESDTPGWIVIRQNWYPGWSATINNDETLEIFEVDYLFQGIKVPSGNHTIALKYLPNTFVLGLVTSLLSLIATSIFLVYYSKHRKTLR
ncbi:MAG TPA: alpha-(1-_3)-arabinofuranosyltransferase family protein, partial [Anaerolineaceae bacterium]|nr:alpha-(1->3)-arabinofuranosyltransferase family protein [Anaerolineaceae bacterium]